MNEKRVALVTGATGGIGSAVCRKLAADGCTVVVGCHKEKEKGEALAQALGGLALFCDVTDPDSVQKAVDNVLDKYCQLDILVCNAGVAYYGLLQEMAPSKWREVLSVDLDGVFYCCRSALPSMISRKSGNIVTISSMWGEVGASCEAAYSAAKAGVIGLTKALAKEVGPSGVRVNCITPGVIDTPMSQTFGAHALAGLAEDTPLGRIGTPEEIAEVVSFLVSPAAGFITGQVVGVNGGFVI